MLNVSLTPYAQAGTEEGQKRQYFPYEMTWTCPRCQAENYRCFASDYLSHPTFGVVNEITCYCDACDENANKPFTLKVIPRLTLELAPNA